MGKKKHCASTYGTRNESMKGNYGSTNSEREADSSDVVCQKDSSPTPTAEKPTTRQQNDKGLLEIIPNIVIGFV